LSGCIKGILTEPILGENQVTGKKGIGVNDIFGNGNFYIELMNHGTLEEHIVNLALLSVSKKLNVPVVAQ